MTDIAFHFNAPGKLDYACRLLRKAFASGKSVVVTGAPATLGELDQALWTFSPLEFIPHCREGAPANVLAGSPVVLTATPGAAPHHEVLVNLGGTVPEGFEVFERLIEVVTAEEDDRQQARQRWRHYASRGYNITRHDLGGEAT